MMATYEAKYILL